MTPKLDFLYCGSAKDSFFAQVAFARICLDALGGPYRGARVAVAFAEYDRPELPERWVPYYDRIEVLWCNPDKLPNDGFLLQHYARFDMIDETADLVILSDADVIPVRPFDDLIADLIENPAIAGVLAHYHFPLDGVRGDPDVDWPRIAHHVLGHDIDRPWRYLFGQNPLEPPVSDPDMRPAAPFYLNYGVLIAPPAMMKTLGAREYALGRITEEITGPYWSSQVALSLACVEQGFACRALPPRYNWATRPETIALYPEEVPKIALIHYMNKQNFRGSAIFAKGTTFQDFIEARYEGSDEIFRAYVEQVTGGTYPFPRPAAMKRRLAEEQRAKEKQRDP